MIRRITKEARENKKEGKNKRRVTRTWCGVIEADDVSFVRQSDTKKIQQTKNNFPTSTAVYVSRKMKGRGEFVHVNFSSEEELMISMKRFRCERGSGRLKRCPPGEPCGHDLNVMNVMYADEK